MSERVVIFGGTSGIGLETAQYLSTQNYEVIICGRRTVDFEGISCVPADVTSDESIHKSFIEIHHKYGDINSLIYSTGITTKKRPISEFDEKIWNSIMDTNVSGFLRVLKYFYSSLKATQGRVVVVNSLAARSYSKYSGYEYTASKAALSGIVRQLAMEWSSDNILINSVFPGMTLTPMLVQNLSDEHLKTIDESVPLKKLAQPIDVAQAIAFLISDKNKYITGSGIDVSGGQFLNG